MDTISIKTETRGSIVILTIDGRIDSDTAPVLDAELSKVVGEKSKLVLNFKNVKYMSSAGIRAVVKASQALKKSGGAVKLAAVPESVNSILYTVGLNQKIGVYATVDEAVSSF